MSEMKIENIKSIDGVDVAGKRVLVRADVNVPVQDGQVSDATRIERVLPGLLDLARRGAKVIVISHFGRPKGERNAQMSLKLAADKMNELAGDITVSFADDCVGSAAKEAVNGLSNGNILMLENLRFHKGETENDADFAKELASLGDLFVSEAFSTAHRAHASTEGVTHHLPSYAGPLMMQEVSALGAALEAPERPVAAVVGGAKVSTKIDLLSNLVNKVDYVIVGGGMANTFLFADGKNVGKSLCEPDYVKTVEAIRAAAAKSACQIVLPSDVVVAKEFAPNAEHVITTVDDVNEDGMILDAGPKSVEDLSDLLSKCKTLVWNGPMGAFEMEPFGNATFGLAKAAAELTKSGKLATIAGGGDTVAALNAAGASDDFTYISTAGGAFLEWLEGRDLPGVVALARNA